MIFQNKVKGKKSKPKESTDFEVVCVTVFCNTILFL